MESGKESTSACIQDSCIHGSDLCVCACIFQELSAPFPDPTCKLQCCCRQRRISSGRPEEHQLCFGAHSSRFELKEDVPLLHYMNVPISAYYYWAWWSAITIFLWRRLYYFTKQTHLCSMIMSKEPIEHLLVKFGLLSRTLLHRIA